MSDICQRLTSIRETLGLNQSNFASELNIKRPTLAGYEKGTFPPSAEYLLKIREIYDVNIDWLLTGEGTPFLKEGIETAVSLLPSKHGKIPIYTPEEIAENEKVFIVPLLDQKLSAGSEASLPETDEETALVPVPARLSKYGKNIAALTVDGDSMYPTLDRGDIVVCDSCGWSGEGIYALRMGGESFVKRLTKAPGKLVIISDNPRYPVREEPESSEDFEIIGRVHCAIKNLE
ncbi:MAG TPA: hypothetical protein DEQ14_05080 [Treponema sp.]|nr:hypothetical protein [Treponema sp.]